ncbi:hypothetical protein G7074_21670 [Pedobacter sp. HDW13]|uniref:sugar-binding domain-containing protein n=1 Tax=Pedobacter sp. HDW13 TaxID=2714940 RepID=UPI00140C1B03|nr:sugar-binding domain-containing protein [Pedobacter sp. HDW13]QIL41643.1 hypothetical protein G7074_21670 [Pedobacter sp. HDW13]
MRINFRLFALLLTLFNISYSYGQDANPSPRLILNLNTRWAFFRDEASGAEAVSYNDNNWTGVSVPHTMRLEPKHNGGNQNYTGIGWYRRYFKIDKANSGKRITLNFDGVQKNCEIYLNGEKLKVHYGGYLGFIVDISDKVKFNDNNLLAVRVSNVDDPFTPPGKMQDKMDFLYYGGIYRDVSLQISNKIHISDPLEAQQIAGVAYLSPSQR